MKARFLALTALVLGLASCQTEPEGLDVNVGGEQLVTINVAVPEAETRAGGSNSALGVFDNGILEDDNTTMRYILQVYYNGEASKERLVKYSDGKSVAFDVRLVPGRDYQFVVWADVVDTKDAEGKYVDKHYNTTDLANITLNNTWVAMDESRDAFTATEFIDNFNSSKGIDIKLKRPFAKLRVVTTDMEALNNLGIVPTKATVTYTEKHYGAFNAFAGKAINDSKNRDIKHENFIIASYGENTAEGADMTLFTDYFFAEDNDVTKFVLDVFDQNNQIIKSGEFTTDIYVKRNNLTTIKGNILTDGKGFDVIIDDAFAGESGKVDGETFAKVDTAEELLDAINKGVENITLDGDINLNDLLTAGTLSTRAAASDVLTVAAGKNITLDLNGKTISYTKECDSSYSMIENKGTLTINDSKGNGKISFTDTSAGGGSTWGSYTICNYGTLVVNDATIEHLGCTGNWGTDRPTCIPIQNYVGKVTVNSGVISSPMFRSLRDFTAGGEIIINGGEFKGQVWMQGLGSGSSSLTINGGEFAPTAGYDGSSIFITNGTNDINVAVTGGFFNTKIGCTDANKAGVKGCIVGGTFTADAIEKTNAALIANGHKAVDNGDGTYNVINLRAPEVEIYGLTLKPDGDNSKIIVKDKEGFLNITKLFNNWTSLFTDGNGTTYTNYANGAGADYYYSGRWTVSLEADIDLNNDTILSVIIKHPVSAGSLAFEGNNHTIKNAKIVTDPATENEAGLFTTLSSCGFKGLKLDNIHVTGSNVGNSTAGVLAGSNHVVIDNITITNSSVEGGKYTGGVIGYGYTDVTNCSLTNVYVKGGYKQGGLIGYICATGANTGDVTGNTLTNCSVDGIGNGIYAGGKSEYIIGKLVGNYNCDGTCDDNVITNMTTSATSLIGKIEAGKVVEGQNSATASTTEDLKEALKDNTVSEVSLSAGTYTFPASDIKAGTTITCEEGTVFTGTSSLDIKGATVIGATFKNDNSIAVRGTIHGNFKNCTFDGSEALRWCYSTEGETTVFENCVVKTNFRGVHFDTLSGTVIFKNCEINGFNAFGGNGEVIFENCTMGCDQSTYNGLNLYLDTTIIGCKFIFLSGKTNFIDMEQAGKTLTIKNCTATLDGAAANVADYVGGSKKGDCTVTIE